MPHPGSIGEGETRESDQENTKPIQGDINVKALAERIYQLLKEEARVERSRMGQRHTW